MGSGQTCRLGGALPGGPGGCWLPRLGDGGWPTASTLQITQNPSRVTTFHTRLHFVGNPHWQSHASSHPAPPPPAWEWLKTGGSEGQFLPEPGIPVGRGMELDYGKGSVVPPHSRLYLVSLGRPPTKSRGKACFCYWVDRGILLLMVQVSLH